MISPENNQTDDLDHSKFEELADQFAREIRQGEFPDLEAYANRHPSHAEAIHRLFPVLELMERKGTPLEDLSEDGLLDAEMAQLNSTPTFQKLGDYQIVREIGRGGMGIVFEARQESLDRSVALKLLPTSAQFDARRQQRFQQEAQASAKLHHTNIVPVFGVGAHEDIAYFVMQYIDGQPLDNVLSELSRIRSGKVKRLSGATEAIALNHVSTIASVINQVESASPFSSQTSPVPNENAQSDASRSSASSIANEGVYWRNIAKIGIQVASALEHAHLRKTLHRDIKPSNLLIDGAGCAWVTDFGLAKYFESPDLTRTGEVVGTLRYMSPEQLNGKSDERSDIFGLGLTLYEMAALKPAYDASDRNQLMQQALEANPRPLRTVNQRVPKDLETIIHKCIASDPYARYQTATLLVNDLERFVAGEPVLARRINPIQRAAKWCRRRPAVASLIAALLFSLFAGTLGIAWQWNKTVDALELANENLGEATRQTALATKNLTEAKRQAVIATENFAEAKRQKEVAQQHFQQARDSVNRFFVLVSQQRLLREPGFAPLRRELMQEALDYHQQFVSQYRDDDELRVELAQSLYHVADIEGQLNANPNIVEELEEPIAIFSDMVESNPDEPNYQLWLARCLSLKSNMLRRSDVTASLEIIDEANDVIEAMLANHPGAEFGANELAKNYQMLGLSYEQIDKASGETERSLANYTKALELRQRIHADETDNLENTIMLAELHRDLGITHRRRGEDEKAIEYYDLALNLLQPIVQEHQDNIMARNSLGSIANSIGFFYGRSNEDEELEKALAHYEISKTQYQELANRSPLVIQYQDGLARAALNAAAVYQLQGDLGKAFQYRSDAAEIREKLCNLNPNAHHIRSSWAVSLNGVGASLRGLNRIDEAIEIHHLALEQHKRVVKTGVMQSVGRLRLIDGLSQLARAQSAGKMFEDAVVSLDAMEEFTQPTDTHPFFSQAREYAVVASKIGKLSVDEIDDGLNELKDKCIGKSKSAFSKAAEHGLDVIKRAESDAVFQNFVETPECAEIYAWMIDRFGS